MSTSSTIEITNLPTFAGHLGEDFFPFVVRAQAALGVYDCELALHGPDIICGGSVWAVDVELRQRLSAPNPSSSSSSGEGDEVAATSAPSVPVVAPADMADDLRLATLRAKKAWQLLLIMLQGRALHVFIAAGSPSAGWRALDAAFRPKTRQKARIVRQELDRLTLDDRKDPSPGLAELSRLTTRLESMGEVIPEETKVDTILNKLGENYSQVKSFIDFGKTKTVKQVEDMVVARFKDLQAADKGKSGGNGHALAVSTGRRTVGRKGRGKGRVICFMCGKDGHIKYDCPYLDWDRHASAPSILGEDDGQGGRCVRCTGLGHEESECPLTFRVRERTRRPSGRGTRQRARMIPTTNPSPPNDSREVEDISSRLDKLEGFIRSSYFGDIERFSL
ncbi:unnamed protein product [Choristocarpus tenellus]